MLGFAALGRLRRRVATNRKTTRVGIVGSAAAVALGIWGMTIVFGAVDQLERDLGDISEQLDRDIAELEEQFEDDAQKLDEWADCVDAIDISADDFDNRWPSATKSWSNETIARPRKASDDLASEHDPRLYARAAYADITVDAVPETVTAWAIASMSFGSATRPIPRAPQCCGRGGMPTARLVANGGGRTA